MVNPSWVIALLALVFGTFIAFGVCTLGSTYIG